MNPNNPSKPLTPEEERMFLAGWLSRHTRGNSASHQQYLEDKSNTEHERSLAPQVATDVVCDVVKPLISRRV